MNGDYLVPSLFMLNFSLSHRSHLSPDVMFVIFSGGTNISVDEERVAPIPSVYLFFPLKKIVKLLVSKMIYKMIML